MKKRIISLILVLVMLCLALASCAAYSIADEDLSAYATFDADSQEKFEAAWKTLVIEDGDFTEDETTRLNKVMDSIYNDLASAVSSDADEIKTGTPSDHDIVYYNYYYTAEIGGKTVYFSTSNMKSGSTTKVQLGLADPSDFEKQLANLFVGIDIKDHIYKTETSGDVKENDVVFITYSYTHDVTVEDETTGESATKSETVTVTNERLVLTKDSSAFVNYLLEKKVKINSSSIEDFEDPSGKTYTGIKINWRAVGNELGTATNTPYTETTKVKDITGVEHDLKDVELTYHVYPTHYVEVPEFNALNFVNVVLDDSISFAAITRVLFGEKFEDKTDDEKKAILDLYITKDKDGKDVSLEDFVKSIATAQKEYDTALDAKEKAENDVTSKQSNYDTAKSKYDAEPNDERKAALDTAETNLKTAKDTLTTATKTYDEKLAARDEKVKALLDLVTKNENKDEGRNNLTDGYITLTYEYLRDIYNEEVRMNLAKAVYELFEKHVTVTDVPEEAVEVTFERLMENYEYDFYNGTYDTTTKQSNYAAHGGSFESFLIEEITVSESITVTSYDMAVTAVKQNAADYIKPVIMIYVLSDAYGLRVTEDEFEDYKESEDGSYNSDSYNYGENSVLYAFQFDKLMNHILEYEEQDDGSYKYKNVVFTFEDAE